MVEYASTNFFQQFAFVNAMCEKVFVFVVIILYYKSQPKRGRN